MTNLIPKFIFISTGAFVIWMVNGFKGPFDKEMVSIAERNSAKGLIRFFLGLAVWIVISMAVISLLTSPTGSETYQMKVNEEGQIIEFK